MYKYNKILVRGTKNIQNIEVTRVNKLIYVYIINNYIELQTLILDHHIFIKVDL